jgi:hypothetical protein
MQSNKPKNSLAKTVNADVPVISWSSPYITYTTAIDPALMPPLGFRILPYMGLWGTGDYVPTEGDPDRLDVRKWQALATEFERIMSKQGLDHTKRSADAFKKSLNVKVSDEFQRMYPGLFGSSDAKNPGALFFMKCTRLDCSGAAEK